MLPLRGQTLAAGVLDRERGLWGARFSASQQHQQRELLRCVTFEATATAIPLPPATETSGAPLCLQFNKNSSLCNRQLLAVGGEEGFITIASTEDLDGLQRDVSDGSWRPRAHWPCHRNSIFDLAWAKNDAVIYTASGHQHVGIWDTDTAKGLAVAEGHEGSVKSVSPLHLCEDVFATGARDGRIMLWDARCQGFSGYGPLGGRRVQTRTGLDCAPVLSPVWTQEGAHNRTGTTGSRASSKAVKPAPVTVTSVAFVPYSYLLLSGGANDTVVKLWDVRMRGLPVCDLELPMPAAGTSLHTGRSAGAKSRAPMTSSFPGVPYEVGAYSCPSRSSAVGVTHITVSDSGDRLLVSCLDSQHHLFSLSRLAAGPLATWCAPPPALKASFYMRSVFSPCGDYVLCGSRDAGAHIWNMADPQRPPVELPHAQEVTGVAWSGGDWGKVATCSDSGEVRVWTLSRLPARAVEDGAGAAVASCFGARALQQAAKVASGSGGGATSAPVIPLRQGTAAPATPAAVRPPGRRMVQLRLNLSRAPRETPTPAPPAAAAASTPVQDLATATTPHSSMPASAPVSAPPQAQGPSAAAARVESVNPPASDEEERAAALRASALKSPVSAAPVQPATRRRSGPLPPVPIFSPVFNRWQPRDTGASPAPFPQPATSSREADAAGPSAVDPCGGLEAAMKALPQVRTQSPVDRPQRSDKPQVMDLQPRRLAEELFMGIDAKPQLQPRDGTDDADGEWLTRRPSAGVTSAATEPPAAATSVPATGSTLLAARVPAFSPRKTPTTSFQRSRSRLGPFSPSNSAHSSGSGPSFSSNSSGGATTPRQHQPPQGVVAQILRNSPRPGSVRSAENLFGLAVPSPRSRAASPRVESGGALPVGRRLFGGPEQVQPLPQPDAWAVNSDGPNAVSAFGWDADNAAAGPNVVGAIGHLLQRPDSPIGNHGSPRVLANLMYDVQDGQEVAPALRYRELHPEDSGPFNCFDGVDYDTYRRISDGGENDGGGIPASAPGLQRAHRTSTSGAGSPRGELLSGPLLSWEDGDEPGSRENEAGGVGDLFAGWALRRLDSSSMRLVERSGSDVISDDGSDFDFDPYGDKENTPPPEPLEAPSADPVASGTFGDGASAPTAPVPGSPRPTTTEQSLPRLLDASAAVSSRSQPSRQGGAAATPFAAALPFPEVTGPDAGVGGFRAVGAPSLHSVPSMGAGMSSGQNAIAAGDNSASNGLEEALSFGVGCLLPRYNSAASSDDGMEGEIGQLAELPPPMATPLRHGGSCGRRCHPGSAIGATDVDASAAGLERRTTDNPSPPKRARKAYRSDDSDEEDADSRLPSPPRSTRPPRVPSCAMPTPMGKQRPSASMVMASPCVRGGRRPGCGVSRLADGGFLGAVSAAAASIGSESPAPKIGTASRTGRRETPAAEEFFRRRAEEDRDGMMMSPFGFGELPGSAAPKVAASVSERRGASRLARGCGAAGLAAVETGQLLFSEGVISDDKADAREELAQREQDEEDFRAIQGSVRSLSCVFETQDTAAQVASTMMVPGTLPAEEEGGAEVQDEDEDQHRRYGAPMRLSFEDRTVASPAPFGMGTAAGGDIVGRDEGAERQGSIGFGSLFGHSQQQQPVTDYQQRRRGSSSGHAAPTPLPLDESSRCFPVAGFGAMANASDALLTGWAGGNGALPIATEHRQPHQQRPHELLQPSFSGFSPHGPLAPPAGGTGGAQTQQLLPGTLGRKHKQQTLRQCWGAGAVPLQGPNSVMEGPVQMPAPMSRPLGPTGLASPRYFR
ncbi:hypothetical protein Agub_g54 [Astrephomene gubernaculifera]|uniref:Uncharacterized protein n=1 Tax=Astrephomene gubernaculifera TaxID=47775 RepID=A0AAD3DE26_9CHLO|nr:hypothetical protein Agub_g54 [Astrephomene gubernaculifera]